MSRKAIWKPGPADALLELLREARLDYRCHPVRDGRWLAVCPLCGEPRLDITERGRGGRVSVRCGHGCDSEAVLRRLTHPERCHACGVVHGQVDALGRACDELLDFAQEQQRLLRSLTDDEPQRLAA